MNPLRPSKFCVLTSIGIRIHFPLFSHAQSAIEETLARISLMGGVEAYVITDGKGASLPPPALRVARPRVATIADRKCTTVRQARSHDSPSPRTPNHRAGNILRQSKGITADQAAKYAAEMMKLTMKARHVVRDLDPKVRGALPQCPVDWEASRWWALCCCPFVAHSPFSFFSPVPPLPPSLPPSPCRTTSSSSG
jgi:hypothetical protein